jgi:hypothetical protein
VGVLPVGAGDLDLVLRVLVTALGLLRWKKGAAVSAETAPNNSVWPPAAAEPLLFLPLPAGCGSEEERKWGVAGVRRLRSWPAVGARRSCDAARASSGAGGGSCSLVPDASELLVCIEYAM